MTRAKYIGWLSDENFGDDIIAHVIKKKASKFWVQSVYPRERLEDRAFSFMMGNKPLGPLIIGGGTLIGGGYSSKILELIKEGHPVLSIGSGVIHHERWSEVRKAEWRDILCHSGSISVRGFRSAKTLQRCIGYNGARVVGDFALATSEIFKAPPVTSKTRLPRIGVNAGSHKLMENQFLREQITELIGSALSKLAGKVTFVPIYMHQLDEAATTAVFNRAGVPISEIIAPYKRLHDVKKYGTLDGIVSERLHGSILGHSYGVPAIGIAYDDKILDHFDVMNQNAFTFSLEKANGQQLSDVIDDIIVHNETYAQQIVHRREGLVSLQDKFLCEVGLM